MLQEQKILQARIYNKKLQVQRF